MRERRESSCARRPARRHEFSVRLALGASRWRLARQQLVESCLLAAAGSAARPVVRTVGSACSWPNSRPQTNTVFLDTSLDWRVLAFTASVGIASRCSLASCRRCAHARNRSTPSRRRAVATAAVRGFAPGGVFVVGQVALSLVLLVAASLFVRTFTSLTGTEPGLRRASRFSWRSVECPAAATRAGSARRPVSRACTRPPRRRRASNTPRSRPSLPSAAARGSIGWSCSTASRSAGERPRKCHVERHHSRLAPHLRRQVARRTGIHSRATERARLP